MSDQVETTPTFTHLKNSLEEVCDELRTELLVNYSNNANKDALRIKLLKSEEIFIAKQDRDLKAFIDDQLKEKKDFEKEKEAQLAQLQKETTKRLREGEEFIRNVKTRLSNEQNIFSRHHSEMFSILECTICMEVSKDPSGVYKIMHCPRNHPVCGECLNKMTGPECLNKLTGQKKCPICKKDIIGRAYTLERLAELLNKPPNNEQEAGKAPKTIAQAKPDEPKRLTVRRYGIGIPHGDESREQDDERRHIRINKDVTTSPTIVTIV